MGFIETHLKYTAIQETTERVHRWVAISVIAAALERKVWLNRGTYTLFPNLYTFIIGPSGKVRKSTSTALGVDLLRSLDTIKMTSERLTAASLIHQLAGARRTFLYGGKEVPQSAAFAYGSELNIFLGEVFGSISELLTTFYDCVPQDASKPWKHQTVGDGAISIYGPCLNFLGASTPAWLARSIPASELEGGFASRVIFVLEENARSAIAFPDMQILPADQEATKRLLLADLRRIHELVGSVRLTDELRRIGAEWYVDHQATHHTKTDPRFSGYYGRKFDTALKISMLLSVSEDSSLVVDARHFTGALDLLQDVELHMMRAFDASGTNFEAPLMLRVWELLCREALSGHPRISMSYLFSALHRDAAPSLVCKLVKDLALMNRVKEYIDRSAGEYVVEPLEPRRGLSAH